MFFGSKHRLSSYVHHMLDPNLAIWKTSEVPTAVTTTSSPTLAFCSAAVWRRSASSWRDGL